MRFARALLLFVVALVPTACAGLGAEIQSRAEPSPTTIGVEVVCEEWVVGELDKQVAGLLMEEIRNRNVGVPVVDNDKADMLLKVRIDDTNFTQALSWQWQLVDARSGSIVDSKVETSVLGHSPAAISDLVMAALVEIDTSVYASSSSSVPVVRRDARQDDGASVPESDTDGSKSWAVVIGVEGYRNELPAASHAERDAKAFAELARTTLGVPESQIKLLLGQRATRTDVMGAISEWLPRNAVEPGGRVYVFFSGHGAPNAEDKGAYLLPWDADPAYLKSGGVLVADLQTELAKLEGQEVYVFLDACFSGSGDRSVIAAGTRPLIPVEPSKKPDGVITLSAAGPGQTTGVAPDAEHGLFTQHLLQGLAGAADANSDADVSLAELVAHVQQNVEKEARRDNREQTPTAGLPKGLNAADNVLVRGLR